MKKATANSESDNSDDEFKKDPLLTISDAKNVINTVIKLLEHDDWTTENEINKFMSIQTFFSLFKPIIFETKNNSWLRIVLLLTCTHDLTYSYRM